MHTQKFRDNFSFPAGALEDTLPNKPQGTGASQSNGDFTPRMTVLFLCTDFGPSTSWVPYLRRSQGRRLMGD